MLYAIVGMLVIILDQGVKYWVTTNLMVGTVTEPLIPGVLSLVRLHNDGAAFSFLAGGGARIYFIILTAVFTVAVIIALVTNFISGKFGRWCLVLVTAGGLSNCLDRVLYGYVVDMFKIELFDFAVFNVADIFITVFCLLFIIYIIFGGEDKRAKAEDEFDEEDDEDEDRVPLRGVKTAEAKKDKREAKAAKGARKAQANRSDKYADDGEEDLASPRFGGARKAKTARSGEDTAARTAKNSDASRASKPKKTRYEEDYEQYKAEHPEIRSASASAVPAYDSTDPFAEWERANARVESSRAGSAAAKAMGVSPAKTETPVKAKTPIIRESSEKSAQETPAEISKPAELKTENVKAESAKSAAPAKKTSDDGMDFSLDDILNEFK